MHIQPDIRIQCIRLLTESDYCCIISISIYDGTDYAAIQSYTALNIQIKYKFALAKNYKLLQFEKYSQNDVDTGVMLWYNTYN